jgi:hypothetical protein
MRLSTTGREGRLQSTAAAQWRPQWLERRNGAVGLSRSSMLSGRRFLWDTGRSVRRRWLSGYLTRSRHDRSKRSDRGRFGYIGRG